MTAAKVALRFVFVLGLALTTLAVGVARLVPAPDAPLAGFVRPARVQYQGVDDQKTKGAGHGCRLLDPDSGRIVSMKLQGNEMLLFARSSPWESPDGQVQVVGRWLSRNDDESRGGIREVGLARCTFPGGEVLDRIAVDVVPLSAPCWFPGSEPRILYGGTDGQLYQFAFDEPGAHDGDAESQGRPRPLRWACEKPGQGEVRISDPSWPTDPRLHGRLLVSITYIDQEAGVTNFVPGQLWWLELSKDGQAIQAAGRLMVDRHRGATRTNDRFPTLAATPDGGLALAYLSRPENQVGWDLRLVPVSIDPETGFPRSRSKASVHLARDVAVAAPTFSSDGRWVHGLLATVRSSVQAQRFSVVAALSVSHDRQIAWRADPARAAFRRAHGLDSPRAPRSERFHGKS